MFEEYYKEIYSTVGERPLDLIDETIHSVVNERINALLVAPVTFQGKEKAIFSLGAHKAPSSDELNGMFFFQKHWDSLSTKGVCSGERFLLFGIYALRAHSVKSKYAGQLQGIKFNDAFSGLSHLFFAYDTMVMT
ncbi:reverse transcriptase [Senna tora]|uniref:Reverse transcriptase n=1 Tax=Senna tora TaxID=362788 RepID=A0A834XB06_9FABA|nr:reverse transcriptase [Senna tora]